VFSMDLGFWGGKGNYQDCQAHYNSLERGGGVWLDFLLTRSTTRTIRYEVLSAQTSKLLIM